MELEASLFQRRGHFPDHSYGSKGCEHSSSSKVGVEVTKLGDYVLAEFDRL